MDGEGARRVGGRWNSRGVPVVYCSSTLALAALEYLVHVDPDNAPNDLLALEIEVPDDVPIESQPQNALPLDWRGVSMSSACQAIGDEWLARRTSVGLLVPSVIIPAEQNLLLNPAHVAMSDVRVVRSNTFSFDPRLLYRI